jgi:hypothetical protein
MAGRAERQIRSILRRLDWPERWPFPWPVNAVNSLIPADSAESGEEGLPSLLTTWVNSFPEQTNKPCEIANQARLVAPLNVEEKPFATGCGRRSECQYKVEMWALNSSF